MKPKLNLNHKFVFNQLGIITIIESGFMLLPVIVSIIYHEKILKYMILSFAIVFGFGLALYLATKKNLSKDFSKRESFLLVTLSWILMSILGTLPFILTHSIPNFINAFFESMSGFTTTGSSILTNIEIIPKSVLFWRSETHWIGGMGIIVLFVALFPYLKTNRIYLFQAEASVVVEQKAMPKIMDIARTIWLIYVGMTIVLTILLMLGHMSLFESLCHAFGTVATGGFSTRNASIGAYSPYIQYVITIFMIMAGVNFALYLMLFKRKFANVFSNEELKTYLSIVFITGLAVTIILFTHGTYKNLETDFRQAYFQVASIITATGFATANYLKWPTSAIILIIMVMLIGGSAGSTSGGIKVIRHLIFYRNFKNSFKQMIHPDIVAPVYYNKKPVSTEVVNNVLTFIISYLLVIFFSTLLLVFMGVDIMTAFGSSATCIGGIGPGLGFTGPAGNFSQIPQAGKVLLSLVMLIGRLEIFTIFVIFTKNFRHG
jgi:trk system potassium uptake protein TrkH